MVDAQEALRIGLANVPSCPTRGGRQGARDRREIAQNGRLAVRGAKRAINALSRPGHENAIAFESSVQAVLFDSDDKKARMDAFLAKSRG
jgi:enoyl-CoA hydratase/carnithine racemase